MYTRSSTSRSCTTLLTLMKWYQQKRRPTREYTPLYAHVTERKKNKHPIPNTDIDTCVPDLRPHAWKITAAISCKEPNVVSSLKSSLKTHPVIECEEMFHMTSDRQAKIFGKLVYINQTIPISVYFSKFIQQFLHCIHLHAVRKISKSDRS